MDKYFLSIKKSKKLKNKKMKVSKKYTCFKQQLSQKEIECYLYLLKIINKKLSKHKINWIPVAGSLLALYRHNDVMIPWDDDYDITIEKKNISKALAALKNECHKYNCDFVFANSWEGGKNYKFFMKKNENKYNDIIIEHSNYYRRITENANKFNWPNIDLFINLKEKKKSQMGAYNLTSSEYPLGKIYIRNIPIKFPTNSFKTYKKFKENNYLEDCYSGNWNHKTEKPRFCLEIDKVKCKNVIIN